MPEQEDFKSARRRIVNALDVGQIGGGALGQLIGEAVDVIAHNMKDLNTDWKAKRELLIKVTFATDEERTLILSDSSVSTKLAPRKALKTKFALESGDGSTPVLREFGAKPAEAGLIVVEQSQPAGGFNRHVAK